MEHLHMKRVRNPEAIIQGDIIAFLEARGWNVMPTHGNAAQQGFPDLYCTHETYGQRWVEVKNPEAYSFTPAQVRYFPLINRAGIGIWIMIAATKAEYAKLFTLTVDGKNGNWREYFRRWQLMGSRNLRSSV